MIYLTKENIEKTTIIKYLTEANVITAPLLLQNSNSNKHLSRNTNDQMNNNFKTTSTEQQKEDPVIQEKPIAPKRKTIKEKVKEDKQQDREKQKSNTLKKTMIIGDSIIKHVDGWRLNKRMKSIVSVRSISGATTKAMKHHVMGCMEDESPDTIFLHHGTNDLRNDDPAEKIATDIVDVALSVKNDS